MPRQKRRAKSPQASSETSTTPHKKYRIDVLGASTEKTPNPPKQKTNGKDDNSSASPSSSSSASLSSSSSVSYSSSSSSPRYDARDRQLNDIFTDIFNKYQEEKQKNTNHAVIVEHVIRHIAAAPDGSDDAKAVFEKDLANSKLKDTEKRLLEYLFSGIPHGHIQIEHCLEERWTTYGQVLPTALFKLKKVIEEAHEIVEVGMGRGFALFQMVLMCLSKDVVFHGYEMVPSRFACAEMMLKRYKTLLEAYKNLSKDDDTYKDHILAQLGEKKIFLHEKNAVSHQDPSTVDFWMFDIALSCTDDRPEAEHSAIKKEHQQWAAMFTKAKPGCTVVAYSSRQGSIDTVFPETEWNRGKIDLPVTWNQRSGGTSSFHLLTKHLPSK